jgi:hypothetical protein
MRAQRSNLNQVWTNLEWDPTRRPVTRSQYKARSVAAVYLSPQEAAVEVVRWLLLQEKLGRRWERTLEGV